MKFNGDNVALNELIKDQAQTSFVNPDNETDTEALGILISQHFDFTGEFIVDTFLSALEDANFSSLRAAIIELALERNLNINSK